jgi:hypothetical protein
MNVLAISIQSWDRRMALEELKDPAFMAKGGSLYSERDTGFLDSSSSARIHFSRAEDNTLCGRVGSATIIEAEKCR